MTQLRAQKSSMPMCFLQCCVVQRFLEEVVFPITAVTQHEELLNISFKMNKAS